MEQKKPAADRVRHILQAMERSIDAARQRRTNTGRAPTPTPAPQSMPAIVPEPVDTGRTESGRLRARPKRFTSYPGYDDRQSRPA